MTLFEQEFLRPGRYDLGGGRSQSFTADQLRTVMRNTLAVMQSGHTVPVLDEHTSPGSDEGAPQIVSGGRRDNGRQHTSRIAGKLVDLWQEADGTLVHVIDVPDDTASAQIQEGHIQHTSPELRESFLDSRGRRFGPLITHVALTRRPRNPDQPPLRLRDGVLQFSLDDLAQGATMMPDQQPPLTTDPPDAEPRPDQPPTPAIGDDESADVGSDQVTDEPELPETDRQTGSVVRSGDPHGMPKTYGERAVSDSLLREVLRDFS